MLDQRFGAVRDPQPPSTGGDAVKPWERALRPSTLMALDESNAVYLKSFLESGLSNEMCYLIARQSSVLWLVDREGRIWFAIEEWLPANDLPEDGIVAPIDGAPRQRFAPRFKDTPKLGHPSLVGGAAARIGGEIILELAPDGTAYWEINKNSGRYSHGREESHLRNVAQAFASYGVNLNPRYY